MPLPPRIIPLSILSPWGPVGHALVTRESRRVNFSLSFLWLCTRPLASISRDPRTFGLRDIFRSLLGAHRSDEMQNEKATRAGRRALSKSRHGRPKNDMLAIGFSLVAAFPLPAHRNAHSKLRQPVERQTLLNVHRVPGRMEHHQVLKVRRVPKHPRIIVTPSTAHRATATVQAEPTAWAMARTIEKMEPVCKPNAHDGVQALTSGVFNHNPYPNPHPHPHPLPNPHPNPHPNPNPTAHDVCKAKAHGVMDNVAFFGAGFSAGQMTGGVENGPSALLEAGLGEAVGNLGKVWCWEDLWFTAVSKAGLRGQPARPKRLVGRGC